MEILFADDCGAAVLGKVFWFLPFVVYLLEREDVRGEGLLPDLVTRIGNIGEGIVNSVEMPFPALGATFEAKLIELPGNVRFALTAEKHPKNAPHDFCFFGDDYQLIVDEPISVRG